MKKFTLCILLVALAIPSVAQSNTYGRYAQRYPSNHESWYRNEFFIAPAYFFDGTFALGYQHNFRTFGLSLMPSMTLRGYGDGYSSEQEGWGLETIGKVFFNRMPRHVQVYAGPYLGYRYLSEDNYDDWGYYTDDTPPSSYSKYSSTTYNIVNFGVLFGVHFMWGRFTLDINGGGGVRYPTVDGFRVDNDVIPDDFGELGFKGIVPKGNITLGVAF